jgi:hypothetical protein
MKIQNLSVHLYIPHKFDYPIHLIPGAERCISEIEFLSSNANISDSTLAGLIEMCKSIKEMELIINEKDNNHGFTKLIEAQKSLINVHFSIEKSMNNESFRQVLEKSLIKHANTMQHFEITKQPTTQILSYFINLKSLKLDVICSNETWNHINNLSLPCLQILEVTHVRRVEFLVDIIENTNGCLSKIAIDSIDYSDLKEERIIQAIYTKCPNLKYLKIE